MKKIRVGDACEILNGYAFKSEKYVASGIRVIRIANVQKGYVEDTDPAFYPEDYLGIDKYMLKEGDLLMSLTGNVGRVAILQKEMLPAALNQRVACLRIKNSGLSKGYLFHFLNSDYFENKCVHASKGVAQKNVSTEWLKEYEIPLYPKEEQTEIENILDKLSLIIIHRKEELNQLDNLIKARFVEMFGDIQSEEKYKNIKLKEICNTVSGGTPSTRISEYYNGEIPWITTVSLGDNYINGVGAKAYITKSAIDNSATKLIPAGNILFGTRVGVGKSSINMVDLCTNQDIVAIIDIDTNKFDRLFIKHVLDMNQPYYDSLKKGATILGITSEDLKDSIIPNVPIEVQNKFSEFVLQIDKSKVEVKKALDEAQLLFDSLMQKYFG
jgi:hypothetical protein